MVLNYVGDKKAVEESHLLRGQRSVPTQVMSIMKLRAMCAVDETWSQTDVSLDSPPALVSVTGHDEPIPLFLEQKVNVIRIKSCDMERS